MIFKAFYRRFLAFIVKAMQLKLTLLTIVGPLASLFEGASVMEFVEDVLFFCRLEAISLVFIKGEDVYPVCYCTAGDVQGNSEQSEKKKRFRVVLITDLCANETNYKHNDFVNSSPVMSCT